MYYKWNRETDLVEPCEDINEWSKEFEKERHIGNEVVRGLRVSTVFLCMEHYGGLFETMVFDTSSNMNDLYQQRYETAAEARIGHAATVLKINRMTAAELHFVKENEI